MITSMANPRMKQLIQLRNRARARREADAFLVEGIRMFCEAPEQLIQEIYVTDEFLHKISEGKINTAVKVCTPDEEKTSLRDANKVHNGSESLSRRAALRLQHMKYETVTEEVFARITDTVSPQGILCVMKGLHYSVGQMLQKKNPYLLLLEDIQDPGNLGTMLRTAEGAGVDGVWLSRGCVDIYNPKVVRATMGTIFRMPFAYVDDLPAEEEKLKEKGVRVYAAALDNSALEYTAADYSQGTAVLIGNEGNGLSRRAVQAASKTIYLPMEGKVESLNASISAAILMYHGMAVRTQRIRG